MSKLFLSNKVVVVTGGAGSGIGHGLSITLAEHGATVLIVEKDIPLMNKLVRKLKSKRRKVEGYECDVASGAQGNATVKAILGKYGHIDGLVNSAGIGMIRVTHECTDEDYARLMSIDLYGTFAFCRAVIPSMIRRKSGSIVNISSIHAVRTTANYGIYAGAKAGVDGFTRGLAAQYGGSGIRANSVQPGLVDGLQSRRLIAQFASDVQGWIDRFTRNQQCLDRLIQARDVGETVAFLLSDRAACIMGASIPVDAGILALLTSKD